MHKTKPRDLAVRGSIEHVAALSASQKLQDWPMWMMQQQSRRVQFCGCERKEKSCDSAIEREGVRLVIGESLPPFLIPLLVSQ